MQIGSGKPRSLKQRVGELGESVKLVVDTGEATAGLGRVLGREAGSKRVGDWGQGKAAVVEAPGWQMEDEKVLGAWRQQGRTHGRAGGGCCCLHTIGPSPHCSHTRVPAAHTKTWLVPMKSPVMPRPPSDSSTAGKKVVDSAQGPLEAGKAELVGTNWKHTKSSRIYCLVI